MERGSVLLLLFSPLTNSSFCLLTTKNPANNKNKVSQTHLRSPPPPPLPHAKTPHPLRSHMFNHYLQYFYCFAVSCILLNLALTAFRVLQTNHEPLPFCLAKKPTSKPDSLLTAILFCIFFFIRFHLSLLSVPPANSRRCRIK